MGLGKEKQACHVRVLNKIAGNGPRILDHSTQEFYIHLEPLGLRGRPRPSYYIGGFKWQVFDASPKSPVDRRTETKK
jgi:hypothetical protein